MIHISDHLKQEFLHCKKLKNLFDRKLAIASIVSQIFIENSLSPPVVVGGSAVEIYTGGSYASYDIDMISDLDELPYLILKELGYKKEGKDCINDDIESVIEFPSGALNGDPEKIQKYLVEETGYYVYIIGMEDLILDRVGSYVATNDQDSKEWAMKLMGGLYEYLDFSYLHKEANRRNMLEELNKLQRRVKWILKKLNKDEISETELNDLFEE